MKPSFMLLAGLLACCVACNDAANQPDEKAKDSTETITDDTYISTTPIPLDGCYRMIINRDTASMRLNVVDSLVTGHLSYHWAEKDQNDGSVKGVVRDSLVILDYTFRSEGMISVRQVVFKLAGNALVEGYGDLNTASDTVRFKNIDNLNYQGERPFVKVSCIE